MLAEGAAEAAVEAVPALLHCYYPPCQWEDAQAQEEGEQAQQEGEQAQQAVSALAPRGHQQPS